MYDKLVTKVNNIDIRGFVLKSKYNTNKSDLEKKISDAEKRIPDPSGLVQKTDLNAKITEIESKIPSIRGSVTNSALTAIGNKIPDVSSNLVKKIGYNTKIREIEKKVTDHDHDKYITTLEFIKLTTENFAARLAQANLVTKTDFDAKLASFNKKINSNKTKHLPAGLKTFHSSHLGGKNYFGNDGTQNYFVFQPMQKYVKKIGNTANISSWDSKGLSYEIIKSPTTSNNRLAHSLDYFINKIK